MRLDKKRSGLAFNSPASRRCAAGTRRNFQWVIFEVLYSLYFLSIYLFTYIVYRICRIDLSIPKVQILSKSIHTYLYLPGKTNQIKTSKNIKNAIDSKIDTKNEWFENRSCVVTQISVYLNHEKCPSKTHKQKRYPWKGNILRGILLAPCGGDCAKNILKGPKNQLIHGTRWIRTARKSGKHEERIGFRRH